MNKYNIKLSELNFGNDCTIHCCLGLANLITVGDVVNYPIEDLRKIRGIGRKYYIEIISVLSDFGIYEAELLFAITEQRFGDVKDYKIKKLKKYIYVKDRIIELLEINNKLLNGLLDEQDKGETNE